VAEGAQRAGHDNEPAAGPEHGPKERSTAWVPLLATSMNSSACSDCGRSGVSAAIALDITMSTPPWRSASSAASPATALVSATSRIRPITRLRVPATPPGTG
jgi:hypothetical protein